MEQKTSQATEGANAQAIAAVYADNAELLREALSNGASFTAQSEHGLELLNLAYLLAREDCFCALVDAGAPLFTPAGRPFCEHTHSSIGPAGAEKLCQALAASPGENGLDKALSLLGSIHPDTLKAHPETFAGTFLHCSLALLEQRPGALHSVRVLRCLENIEPALADNPAFAEAARIVRAHPNILPSDSDVLQQFAKIALARQNNPEQNAKDELREGLAQIAELAEQTGVDGKEKFSCRLIECSAKPIEGRDGAHELCVTLSPANGRDYVSEQAVCRADQIRDTLLLLGAKCLLLGHWMGSYEIPEPNDPVLQEFEGTSGAEFAARCELSGSPFLKAFAQERKRCLFFEDELNIMSRWLSENVTKLSEAGLFSPEFKRFANSMSFRLDYMPLPCPIDQTPIVLDDMSGKNRHYDVHRYVSREKGQSAAYSFVLSTQANFHKESWPKICGLLLEKSDNRLAPQGWSRSAELVAQCEKIDMAHCALPAPETANAKPCKPGL